MEKSTQNVTISEQQVLSFKNASDYVERECPINPVYCVRPHVISLIGRRFLSKFKGNVLYAIKCNTEPIILNAIWESGVRHFDCASLKEILLVRMQFPSASIHFLHPIKSKSHISQAYFNYGVRTFALDSLKELEKIIEATSDEETCATDLTLLVRLALPDESTKTYSVYSLSGKFGVEDFEETLRLLTLARKRALRLGVCFHVGSQCMDPKGYTEALTYVSQVIERARIPLEIIDVGGGFPVSYPDMIPPDLDSYIASIEHGFRSLPCNFVANAHLWCEPGRLLVAASSSIIIRVEACRDVRNILHVNDGIYGNLSELGIHRQWKFPYRLLRNSSATLAPFSLFGPTCDNADYMPGPFLLPSDIHDDDYIEIGQFGAYNVDIRTRFNGFDETLVVQVQDSQMILTPGLDDYRIPSISHPLED